MRLKITILLLITFVGINAQKKYPLETVIQKGHLKYVTCTAFSSNGKYVLTGSKDNTIKLWNIENGKEIRSFNQHTNKINSVSFSADGTKILSSSADNTAIIFDVLTGNVLQKFSINKYSLRKAVFSPNDSLVLTMNNRDETILWDANNGKEIGRYKKDFAGVINTNWFSPNSEFLLSYANYKQSLVVNTKTNKFDDTLSFDKSFSMQYSNDRKYIAIGSSKLFAIIFDAKTGKEIHKFKDDEKVKCDGCKTLIDISHNSKFLITGSEKTGVSLWNIKSGKRVLNIKTDRRLKHIKFSPNDKYIIASGEKIISIFNTKTGKKIFEKKSEYFEYFEPYFSPNSKYIIAPNYNNTAVLWDVTSGRKKKTFKGYLNTKRKDGLKFKDTDWTSTNILRFLTFKSGIEISPDGKYFVKGNIDSTAVMVDIATGKIVRKFIGHSKVVYAFDFTNDGKILATAGGDRYIKLWNTATGKEIRTIKGHKDLIFDIKFSSDGKYLISGSWDATIRVWETATGKEVKYINLKNISPYVVGFTPNNLYAISADLGNSFKFWELDAGKEFRSIVGHTDVVSSFDFSPNGKTVTTGSFDGKIKLWDVLTGMLLNKFDNQASIYSVAFHPQGKYIAFGSADRTIKLWDTESGKIIKTLTGYSNTVTSVRFTTDGNKLISCSVDGVVKIWDLSTYNELYTYIQIDNKNWLAKNNKGYFDGSKDALKAVNYVSGMEVITVGSLFEKYYTPNLIKRIMEGEKFTSKDENINEIIKKSPKINIKITDVNNKQITTVSDSVYKYRSNKIPINIDISKEGSKLDEVRVYNNEKLVYSEKLNSTVVFRGGNNLSKTFDIPLADGDNNIKVIVINDERTESTPTNVTINYDGEDAKTDLYILAIGINNYENPQYNLNFAVNDAKAYVKALKKNAKSIFNNVEVVFIKNEEANKANILEQVKVLTSKVGPEDVFLFYYAGHGVMNINKENESEFFVVTHNVTNLYGDTEMLKEKAISASEIMEFSKNILAGKQLFILDACQSGAAIKAFATRGDNREKAIAQLARSTGTFFLTASQDIQYANEAGNLQHGLFTYAILEALSGNADSGRNDKKITANEIKAYVEDRVPELSEQYHGSPQYPTGYSFGQDFPLVIVK